MIFLNDQQAQIEIWKLLMEYANMLEVDSGLIEDLLDIKKKGCRENNKGGIMNLSL